MSRQLRIEYEGAYYHVMNRGAGFRDIFSADRHRHFFIDLLSDLHETYKVNIHAYCLMNNHYHLLLETPLGNLSRSMRHINGVYTQRYNRDVGSDGPLFRGRFKAIIIEADAYLLNVSRYIHRNPVEDGIVRKAELYPWSSYANFIEHRSSPTWLSTKNTLRMIGVRNQVQRYRAFVEDGIDQITAEFYGKKRTVPILGTDSFVKNVSKGVEPHREIPDHPHKKLDINFDEVIQAVASVFQVTEASLFNVPRGRGKQNTARSAAIYVSHKKTGRPLSEIAAAFGLAHYGSVSGLTNRFAKQLEQDTLLRDLVDNIYLIINV